MTDKIKKIVGEQNIFTNVPMSQYTTFRVGGNAAYLVNVESEESLIALLKCLREAGMKYYLLGNGSNLLISDRGFDGVMIRLCGDFLNCKSVLAGISDNLSVNYLHAGAAASLSKVAQLAAEEGVSGMEFAFGIPGTIGGAVVMNAGAYGGEMKQVVHSVRLLDEELRAVTLSGEEMAFGYRSSILKQRQMIVLSVELELFSGDQEQIRQKMNDNMSARREKQPLEYPSAGSTFKRPEGYFAGKLIQDAGLRGYSVGGAQVSEKHCGFVINRDNATASDVYQLIRSVQEKVRESSGVMLEPEVIMLGEFGD